MEKDTKEILKAKQEGNKDIVQKLQQGMDKYKKEINKTFKKIEGSLNDSSETEEYPYECESKADMPQKTSTAEDTVAYIKENYPETEENLQRVLNDMYLTFCKKQFDYGPGNIAMGTSLKNEEEVNIALLGIIVRLNDKINRLVNLSTKHNFEAQNEPIEDAFLDTAIYAAMALIVKNQKWGK
jgi:RNA polymerase-binding transcription factor DksA